MNQSYDAKIIVANDIELPYINVKKLPHELTHNGRLKVEILDLFPVSRDEIGSVEKRIAEILAQNDMQIEFRNIPLIGREAFYEDIAILTLTTYPGLILNMEGQPDHAYVYLTRSGNIMTMPHEIASKAVNFKLLKDKEYSPLIADTKLPVNPIHCIYQALKGE